MNAISIGRVSQRNRRRPGAIADGSRSPPGRTWSRPIVAGSARRTSRPAARPRSRRRCRCSVPEREGADDDADRDQDEPGRPGVRPEAERVEHAQGDVQPGPEPEEDQQRPPRSRTRRRARRPACGRGTRGTSGGSPRTGRRRPGRSRSAGRPAERRRARPRRPTRRATRRPAVPRTLASAASSAAWAM